MGRRLRDMISMGTLSLSLQPTGATALYIDVDLVYLWEEMSSTPSYTATLNQNPINYLFISPFIPSAKIIFHIRKWS